MTSRARLVSHGAGSKRRRDDGRSIKTLGGFARYVLLIGGYRDHRRERGGLHLRNARRQCAQADEPAALPVGTLAVGNFRMLVLGAILVNVRFAAVVLMMDVSRAKAVIVVREAVHDARGITDGKSGGGSQHAKQVEQGDCARHARFRRSGQAHEHRLYRPTELGRV
jgi:hypothetical protein